MASEITVGLSLSCLKSSIMSSAVARSIASTTFNMSGLYYVEQSILVGVTATVIPLGQVTAPHWAFFINKDATNFIKIRNGASGADLAKLLAGECALIPLLDSAVPYAIADTAACQLEYLIFSL